MFGLGFFSLCCVFFFVCRNYWYVFLKMFKDVGLLIMNLSLIWFDLSYL